MGTNQVNPQQMYDSGDHRDPIPNEFGVARPTIYRHVARLADSGAQNAGGGNTAHIALQDPRQ